MPHACHAGKSTLADQLLIRTGTVEDRDMQVGPLHIRHGSGTQAGSTLYDPNGPSKMNVPTSISLRMESCC